MRSLLTPAMPRRLASAMILVACLNGGIPRTYAADTASESAQLATIERQLDTVDRLAAQSEQLPDSGSTHEHFDYARLHADIARVREGIQDYLNPRRPLPRDPSTLVGHYRVRTDSP
ncbi:integrative conjugative element protein, RAQPRD family [Burkholderia pseudomallei]|uniref:integrative conjugative element protein, RAQPRD family n=1 Tax=Burkholderia pseudomallei TaxID=28450 RepID=UPI0005E65D2D|nr:RAQPRD family integrative conjugative element protein [Burkholderia pseudomallei]CAK1327360.1 integrative conjugative element protein, RAQPRD family [Burkholderia pseudomallei]CAK1338732.1 integrative conjugative element protein, RAQPRD family [Burkholderia pseudomallei]